MALEAMRSIKFFARAAAVSLSLVVVVVVSSAGASAQKKARAAQQEDAEFGPIVRAYLGYLHNQQEVVDDRISRREIDRAYYVRNSNRIRALRQMAIRIARETENDYLPELEAVARDEFTTLFDEPPQPDLLQVGETFFYQFRYLGAVASGRDKFYVFARLDPYEQAELKKADSKKKADARQQQQQLQSNTAPPAATRVTADDSPASRPRRVISP